MTKRQIRNGLRLIDDVKRIGRDKRPGGVIITYHTPGTIGRFLSRWWKEKRAPYIVWN